MKSDDVKKAASGRWPEILSALCGLTEAQTTPGNRGMPCPHCNGHDRYEFKSVDDGFHMCRGCGAGDGFSMVMKMNRYDFREALQQIAEYLGEARPVERILPPSLAPQTRTREQNIEHRAQSLYGRAAPADPNHPYLVKKNLPHQYFRQHYNNLMVPVFGPCFSIVNVQFIRPDSSKFFMKGGRVKGCFTWFGNSSCQSIYVTEGVANALSIYLMSRQMAVSALCVGNIESVAKMLRSELPEHKLILFMDNDRPTEKRPWRPGATALHAHRFFDAVEIPPPDTDASDIFQSLFHVKQ